MRIAPPMLKLIALRHGLAAVTIALAVASTPLGGQGSSARGYPLVGQTYVWGDTDTSHTIPVSFSFSGGISLGAYQAGVNWAMVEFFKKLRDDPAYRARNFLPRIVPQIMTGASAGNINVLLASIESCDAVTMRGDSASLFWKMWVYTGWNELAPPGSGGDTRSSDPGVLDRRAIRSRVMASIDTALRTRPAVAGCRIPIGVVATRVAAGSVGLDPHIEAQNQRYAGLFEVRAANGRLELAVPPQELVRAQDLGAQLIIPPEDNGNIAADRVFDLVEASAAYPVAFAPRVLVYQDPECVLNAPVPPGCRDVHHESFLDGGVFDNNPVGLANGMARLVDRSNPRPIILYVDPSATRGALRDYLQHAEAARVETQAYGVTALFKFVGGFIPSARNYELQTFIRDQLASLPKDQAQVQSSTRAHPVVGEHIDAFAAFFGRPFRQFDFYAGVSDGFQYLASQILCDSARILARDRGGKPLAAASLGTLPVDYVGEPTDHLACIRRQTDSLLNVGFGLSPAGKVVVARVASREFPETFCGQAPAFLNAQCNIPVDSIDARRRRIQLGAGDTLTARVLLGVEEATYDQLNPTTGSCNESGDLAAQLLCFDGFGRLIDSLTKNKTFANAIDQWANNDPCGSPARSYAGRVLHVGEDKNRQPFDASRCRAEFLLEGFVENSHATMQDIIDHLLQRLRSAEEQAANEGKPDSKFLVKTVDFVYRSDNLRSRRGLELDASSIPPNDKVWWQALHFVPYYAGGAIGVPGSQIGWKPTAYFSFLHTIADLPIEIVHLPNHYDIKQPYAWYSALTPGVGHDFSLRWLNQLSVGPRFEFSRADHTTEGGVEHSAILRRAPTMFQASATMLLGKVRLSIYRAKPNYPVSQRPKLMGEVSLADLNGILYWVFR